MYFVSSLDDVKYDRRGWVVKTVVRGRCRTAADTQTLLLFVSFGGVGFYQKIQGPLCSVALVDSNFSVIYVVFLRVLV
jgi:hypothetical protein